MIRLTRLNGENIVLNSELIESLEATPDTVITITSGRSMMVRESINEVIQRASEYRRSLMSQTPLERQTANGDT